jgi:hypothetical protein
MGSEFVFCTPHIQFWNCPAHTFFFCIIYRKGSVVVVYIIEFLPFSISVYITGHGVTKKG